MAFGPGHVAANAAPDTPGNTVLSGHRVTQVVHARDLAILGDTGEPQLTLVTCFPFDAIAPGGPLRYVVVRAARVRPALRARATGAARGPARVPSRLPRA
jgi:sortase (surface protein transpeptidase)